MLLLHPMEEVPIAAPFSECCEWMLHEKPQASFLLEMDLQSVLRAPTTTTYNIIYLSYIYLIMNDIDIMLNVVDSTRVTWLDGGVKSWHIIIFFIITCDDYCSHMHAVDLWSVSVVIHCHMTSQASRGGGPHRWLPQGGLWGHFTGLIPSLRSTLSQGGTTGQ